ncbi:protein HOMOLOG OF MAMMALIAN LYST-INTERACTING PROTEIN 5 isoform X2 [Dioscorea cayenensis subsp. rotundata]|uniref:Protein HOMOLOG OF MAMMALIAN LYST-INTERACTING PROTEIN 5 isoform X2 n=1 Tax=Dioscorea cayennensis subsp. rotundata TaxID=55577 RepID=A0AB40B194_DIOCR|nr:protein HOMOLOG OF MAMMALIAN LYST-INTERACTING PROTEIN 5 isoform X2 [Dioscorea cayenensis subsp. rotundata]
MASEPEPAKLLLPYLQRADELQKHEPLVAYYCRLYAMEKGLKIPQKERTKTTNALLISLMSQLEKDKKSLTLGPDDNLYVEGFAANVFAKADKQDRAGRADLNTAKTFYAASIFYEILSQFGELQPDIEQKQKYAIWKAADIRKALKEGRKPEPGPPGGDKDLSVDPSSPSNTYNVNQSESFSAGQPATQASSHYDMGRSESFQPSFSGADTSSQHSHDLGRTKSFQDGYPGADISSQPSENINPYAPPMTPSPHSSYPSHDYPPTEYNQFPPDNRHEISGYPQNYHHQQSYSNEQSQMPQNYHAHDNTGQSYSYPNFQSYPGFNETSFPTVPTHQPYYQSPDPASSQQSSPAAPSYPSTVQYDSGSGSKKHAGTGSSGPPASSYTYDSNYHPPIEKVSEAHKAARFAVGALAFDDVSVAVDYLRRSLELLTNPSAETHQ